MDRKAGWKTTYHVNRQFFGHSNKSKIKYKNTKHTTLKNLCYSKTLMPTRKFEYLYMPPLTLFSQDCKTQHVPAGALFNHGNVSLLGVLLPTPFSDITLNRYETHGDSETTTLARSLVFFVVTICFHFAGSNSVRYCTCTFLTGL